MSKILNLSDEIALIDLPDFELGKYIYHFLRMSHKNGLN